jgi:curved DNA-binding protein CbpA
MIDKVKEIKQALNILEVSVFISFKEIKSKYKKLSKKYHPDVCNDKEKMIAINQAYELIKEYIENFRFSFDEEEINKQYPESYHTNRFRF